MSESRVVHDRRLSRLTSFCVAWGAGFGATMVVAYGLRLEPVMTAPVNTPNPVPWTAVSFVMCGVALWLVAPTREAHTRQAAGRLIVW